MNTPAEFIGTPLVLSALSFPPENVRRSTRRDASWPYTVLASMYAVAPFKGTRGAVGEALVSYALREILSSSLPAKGNPN